MLEGMMNRQAAIDLIQSWIDGPPDKGQEESLKQLMAEILPDGTFRVHSKNEAILMNKVNCLEKELSRCYEAMQHVKNMLENINKERLNPYSRVPVAITTLEEVLEELKHDTNRT
jgi:hypothetical protein